MHDFHYVYHKETDEQAFRLQEGEFEGVVAHYHLTRRKKDTAGLELKKILEDIRN